MLQGRGRKQKKISLEEFAVTESEEVLKERYGRLNGVQEPA